MAEDDGWNGYEATDFVSCVAGEFLTPCYREHAGVYGITGPGLEEYWPLCEEHLAFAEEFVCSFSYLQRRGVKADAEGRAT